MIFEILFEDDDILAANKPAGLPSQPTLDKSRKDFYTLLKEQLIQRDGPEAYLALHHRLDRDTSGIMLFAKSKRANLPIANLFKGRDIQKTYWCLINAKNLPEKWEVKNFLAPFDDKKTKRSKMHSVHSGGAPALTSFALLQKLKRGQLIEASPKTGRMHQIRVHLSEFQRGIYGDDLYHSPQVPKPPRLMLHARSLEFTHPLSGEPLKIEAPLPQDFLDFQDLLNSEKKHS